MTRKKKNEPKVGDLVAIPLSDGTVGLGHVVGHSGYLQITIALLPARSAERAALPLLDPGKPIACYNITGGDIRDGDWPIVGQRDVDYPADVAPRAGKSWTDNICTAVLERWHGLREYNMQGLLLPGVELPQRTIAAVVPKPRPADRPLPPPSNGPAEIGILISYEGNGMPTAADLKLRQEFERRIEASGFGEVTDAGAGQGLLEVYVAATDVAKTRTAIDAILDELGLSARAVVEVGALEPGDGPDTR